VKQAQFPRHPVIVVLNVFRWEMRFLCLSDTQEALAYICGDVVTLGTMQPKVNRWDRWEPRKMMQWFKSLPEI
jgi:hypothetical protein